VLGELIRHLQAWQSLFEAEGVDSLTGPDGNIYCLADLLRLRELSRYLDPLQAMAIHCLYLDLPDAEAAQLMNTDGTRPVAEYADEGLRRLCAIFERPGGPAGGVYGRELARGNGHAPGAAAAPERGLPPAGGPGGCPDSGVLAGRDLAYCQV
jgi:hypothetical protein